MLKNKLILFLLLTLGVFHHGLSQKILTKLADKTCDCINQKTKSYKGSQPDLFQACLIETINANIKALEKEYGKGAFTNNEKNAEEIGLKIGRLLATRCQTFLDFYFSQDNP